MDTNPDQQFRGHPGVERSHLRTGSHHPALRRGKFLPVRREPCNLDAAASVNIRLFSILTHADGSTEETVYFDDGMHLFRDTIGGALLANPTNDALGPLAPFDEPDGSFGFRLLSCYLDFLLRQCRPWARACSSVTTISPWPAPALAKPASSPPSAIPSISARAAAGSSSSWRKRHRIRSLSRVPWCRSASVSGRWLSSCAAARGRSPSASASCPETPSLAGGSPPASAPSTRGRLHRRSPAGSAPRPFSSARSSSFDCSSGTSGSALPWKISTGQSAGST